MARNRFLLPALGIVTVAVACLAALLMERSIAQVPGDLAAYPGDFLWRPNGTVAFTDGSGRSLALPYEGTLSIGHQAESVQVPVGLTQSAVLGITPDNRALTLNMALHSRPPKERRLTLVSQGIGESTASASSSFPVLEPTVEQVDDVMLSPEGTQLAWQWITVRDAPGVGLLRRFSPALAERFTPRRQVEVWVSDPWGRHLHPVATAPFETPPKLVIGWSPQNNKLVISYQTKHYQLR